MSCEINAPTVSVIIPCYNYGTYLLEAVKSVKSSTYTEIEIIIVNDGSTDEYTKEVLRSISSENGVRVIDQLNGGLSSARNTGIRQAQGKYILPLDADDLIDPTLIMKAVWHLESALETMGFVYSNVLLFGTEDHLWKTDDFDFHLLLHDNYIPATALYKKEMWESAGGYDESMKYGYEDWEFWIRCALKGWQGIRLQEVLFFYRRHGISMLHGSRQKHDEITAYIRTKHIQLYGWKYYYKSTTGRVNRFVKKQQISVLPRFKSAIKKIPGVSLLLKMIHIRSKRKPNPVRFNNLRLSNNRELCRLKSHEPTRPSVLFVLPWLDVGGVEMVFLNIIKKLDRNRFQIHLMTTERHSNPWHSLFAETVDNIYCLPNFCHNEDQTTRFMLDYMKANTISCVHISNSQFGYRMTSVIKEFLPKLSIVDTLHMEEPHEAWDYFRFSMPYSEFLDRRVVITNYLKERLKANYGEAGNKIVVISNGIENEKTNSGKANDQQEKRRYIVFVGRFVEQKNPLLFIEIAKTLIKRGVHDQFLMVGDGPLFKIAMKKIKKMNIESNIQMLGHRNDVKEILKASAILMVAPSQREGLPIIGLEAMSTGVPIVASNVVGWSDLIKNGEDGYLVKVDSILEYVQAIKELLHDRGSYLTIAENAREKIHKQYTVEKMTNSYELLYENCIKEKREDLGNN